MRQFNIQIGVVVFLSIIPMALTVTPNFSKVRLSLVETGFHYDATVSKKLGLKFDTNVHLSNLMLPPKTNVDLCHGTGLSSTRSDGAQHSKAVALLVEPGNCSVQEQVETAAVIKKSKEPMVTYLIFQGDGTDQPDTLPNPDHRLGNVTVDTVGYLFVTLRSGRSMEETLTASSIETSGKGPSPYLLDPGNEDWHVSLAITPDADEGFQQVDTVDTMFSYLIFVGMLFLLVCVPCCAGFLQWWRGGGHVDITRQGARVSVEVIQAGVMSRSEVLALPEIVYHKKSEPEEGYNEEVAPKLTRIDSAIAVTQHHSNGLPDISLHESDNGDCEAPSPPLCSTDSAATSECSSTTTSTICSICIQDFEEGERIRLLPLCGHAYHTDCILPWLTVRHSLCPSCRAPVASGQNGNTDERARMSCHDSIIFPPV
jgi:hypothetical protein